MIPALDIYTAAREAMDVHAKALGLKLCGGCCLGTGWRVGITPDGNYRIDFHSGVNIPIVHDLDPRDLENMLGAIAFAKGSSFDHDDLSAIYEWTEMGW